MGYPDERRACQTVTLPYYAVLLPALKADVEGVHSTLRRVKQYPYLSYYVGILKMRPSPYSTRGTEYGVTPKKHVSTDGFPAA